MDAAVSRISHYEITGRIGRGGAGTVYLARDPDPNTDRLVALKLFNATFDSGDSRQRFAQQAKSLADLNHPSIITIYDTGEFQGSPFIVMEYVRGETLAERIARRAPVPVAQKLTLMAELCSGLARAHQATIIHRDITPANVMVDQQGRLKILGFGIARVDPGQTGGGGPLTTQVGTPGYMSPEQIEGGEVDHRSDLFSVGTVFYELVSGHVAFPGESTRHIKNSVLHEDPTPLASLMEDLEPEIEGLIGRAIQKDVNQRYESATAFEQAITRVSPPFVSTETVLFRYTPVPRREAPRDLGSRRTRAADAAYERARVARQDGADGFARRSAIEALAEDPHHTGARAFLADVGALADIDASTLPQSHTQTAPMTVVLPRPHVDLGAPAEVDASALPQAHTETAPMPVVLPRPHVELGAPAAADPTLPRMRAQTPPATVSLKTPRMASRSGPQPPWFRYAGLGVGALALILVGAALFTYLVSDPPRPVTDVVSNPSPLARQPVDPLPSPVEPPPPPVDLRPPRVDPSPPRVAPSPPPVAPPSPRVAPSPPPVDPVPPQVDGDGDAEEHESQSTEDEEPPAPSMRVDLLVTVVDATEKDVLSGVLVTLNPGGFTAETNANGRWLFEGLAPGQYQVTASRESHFTYNDTVDVDAGRGDDDVEIELIPLPDPRIAEEAAEAEIRITVEEYRSAFEDLDLEGVKAVYPDAPERSLSNQFSNIENLTFTFAPLEFTALNVDAGTATVAVKITRKQELKVGPDQDLEYDAVIFLLRRDSEWFIADIDLDL